MDILLNASITAAVAGMKQSDERMSLTCAGKVQTLCGNDVEVLCNAKC